MMLITCGVATYTGNTRHFFIKDGWFSDPWVALGERTPTVTAPPCDEDEEEEPPPTCQELGNCELYNCCSPVIVDTAGDGFRLTSAAEGVWFDLDGDGVRENSAWTLPDSDDGWLAMDRNGNGRIDDGTELFGDHTPAYQDQRRPTTANGFVALSFLENPVYGRSFADGILNARDTPYGRLVVWIDSNHDGESHPSELRPLSEIGLLEIETEYKESGKRDGHGNEYRQRAIGWWQHANAQRTPRYLYDVWLTVGRRAQ